MFRRAINLTGAFGSKINNNLLILLPKTLRAKQMQSVIDNFTVAHCGGAPT